LPQDLRRTANRMKLHEPCRLRALCTWPREVPSRQSQFDCRRVDTASMGIVRPARQLRGKRSETRASSFDDRCRVSKENPHNAEWDSRTAWTSHLHL
jgi:hypothetical protein